MEFKNIHLKRLASKPAAITPAIVPVDTAADHMVKNVNLPPIVLDNLEAAFAGDWTNGAAAADKFGADYRFANCVGEKDVPATAIFRPNIPVSGKYYVEIYFPWGANRSTNALWTISAASGVLTTNVNQQQYGGKWFRIASNVEFEAGDKGFVNVANNTGEATETQVGKSVVVADAVRFVPVEASPEKPASIAADNSIILSEDFESGQLADWLHDSLTIHNTNGAQITLEQNHTPDGKMSLHLSLPKLIYRRFPEGLKLNGPAKATFWMYVDKNPSAYGIVHAGNQLYMIGVQRLLFSWNQGEFKNETPDPNYFQGRILRGNNTGWFNLNAPTAPKFSVGWHKFEIERLPDGLTYNYYVDGQLGRQIKDTQEYPWHSVEVGSSYKEDPSPVIFDDIKVESLSSSQKIADENTAQP